MNNPKMNAGNLCSFLDWDSKFFGIRIARIQKNTITEDEVRLIDAWCDQEQIECLYFLARSDDASISRTVEAFGYSFVDVRMTFSREISGQDIARPNSQVRLAQPEDLPHLLKIAGRSHTDSRFYYDLNFPRHLCDSLYETWLESSFAGYADAVFVATRESLPVGYITCHVEKNGEGSTIGLLGVSEQARRLGIGPALITHALSWFRVRDINTVSVVTQGRNIAAQRLYQKQGFRSSSLMIWYHKWYSRRP